MTNQEVFLLYLKVVGGFLLAVPLITWSLETFFHKSLSAVWRIYRGWIIMIPPFLLFLYLGREVFILGVLAISVFSVREYAHATGLEKERWPTIMVYLGLLAVAITALARDPFTDNLGWYGLFVILPVYLVGLIVLVPILQNRVNGQLQIIALGVLGFVYFGWMFGHLSFLSNSQYRNHYVLFIVFAAQLSDIAAYNFGKIFGRHKLRSNISPNKTVEGALGALLVSFCLPWLFRSTLPALGPLHLVLTSLIIGFASPLGDLVISLIKRDVGIKDMGASIPGHGGILDRIDSLIIAVPLFFHMLRYFDLL